MCGPAAEDDTIERAAGAARAMLEKCYGVRVAKAIDISTADGFDQVVAEMAGRLRGKTRDQEADAVRAALRELDVDWSRTDRDQRRRLVNAAMEAAARHLDLIPAQIGTTLEVGAADVIDATRDHLRGARALSIGATWNQVDRRVADHLVRSTGNFVTDEYKARNDSFGEEAKQIVEAGVARGLGREEIARELEAAALGKVSGRSRFYWEVIAGSFVGRGRSFSQLSGYAEAGIDRYRIVAMLDERTSQICRFLDGKTFSVADGLRAFEAQEQISDPEQIKKVAPWGRVARDPESGREVLFVNHSSGRRRVADVERSGVGARDDVGEFSSARSPAELAALGLSFPPYHGLCRSTTIPAD